MISVMRWVSIAIMAFMAIQLQARAERFTPAITPTHLSLINNGLGQNAMLLTRTSMPPGLTAASPAYTAPTADQLADEHASWAWIGPTARPGSVPLAFLVSRVAEIAVANQAWPQLSRAFFALRMFNGSVLIFEATGAQDANGVAEFSAPYWLSGVYSEMTAGESHMCFLTTNQHVECMTTTTSFPAPTALMGTRSAIAYTQLAAASRFTCGLRALDQVVECFGAVGRDDHALTAVNYASILRYASIAAQFDNGFCGIVTSVGSAGKVACYSIHATGPPETVVLPAPTMPLSFIYSLSLLMDGSVQLPWSQACAMRSDGLIDCVIPLSVGNSSVPRPMTQTTMVYAVVQGATSDSGQLQRAEMNGWISDSAVSLFEVMRFIGVDPEHGDDATCAGVRTQIPAEMLSFVPCASVNRALSLITHPHTWVQLLPSVYSVGSISLNYSETTISSSPPSCFTPGDLAQLGSGAWATRMDETAGQTVTIDCTGSLNCFSTMQSNIQLIGLSFTGSSQHAVVSSSDNSTDVNSRLPDSSLTISTCAFDAMGAVLLKTKGSVVISDCTITNSLEWANTTLGLIELDDASLTMSGTSFAHNHLPVSDTIVRSCLRSVSSSSVTLMISDSHWLDSSASLLGPQFSARIPGGAALQAQANGPLTLSVSDSTFTQQSVRCEACSGGAVSVTTGAGSVGDAISTSFTRCTFSDNLNLIADVDPNSDDAYNIGSTVGGSLAIGDADLSSNPTSLLTAADVVIEDCVFQRSQAMHGGCLFIGASKSLMLTGSVFDGCTASIGGAAYMGSSSAGSSLGFLQLAFSLSSVNVTNSHAFGHTVAPSLNGQFAGAFMLTDVKTPISIDRMTVSDVSSVGDAGALFFSGCTSAQITDSWFSNITADYAGAIAVDSTSTLDISNTAFVNIHAASRGGVVGASNCEVHLTLCTFVDVGLRYQERDLDATRVLDRLGGVVAASGGAVIIVGGSITRASALPNDQLLSSCAKYYDASAGLSSIGLGGVVSGEYSQVYLYDVSVSEVATCSGGLVYSRSSLTMIQGGTFSNIQAHSGGLLALVAVLLIEVTNIVSTHAISAVAAGGAFLFNECPLTTFQSNQLDDITVSNGDGGLFCFVALRRPALTFTDNILSAITAPLGAGAIIFVSSAPNAFAPLDPIDDSSLNNVFANQTLSGPPSLYGPLIATGVATLNVLQPTLSVPAGSLLSTSLNPLEITALDSLEQIILQDRGLIVQVTGPDEIEFRGTTLRKIDASDGSALFSDLRVIAEPGSYTLTFSIVTAPQVSIALNLTVTADCPAASFYSSSDRNCIPCSSDILVYNATANACQRCPAGWQRVAANDTSGALRDGVSCSICPLGQVSSAGGLCAPCGPNTYQPTPLSECVQCSTVDGLSCVGDGLAQVQSGYFALAVGSGTQQRIQTYQCPETFCSAAEVQVATASGNSSAIASASAVNSFSQCAYPRLASPTNLLCGECAEGYHPWGNKCASCDSVDAGLMVLLVVLSLLLCFWLVYSSLGTSSAGHAVVVLYFVQTAMLELGSVNHLLSWLNIVLLSPNSVSRCVAPLSPYEQVQAQILMPVALWIELMVIATIHFLSFKRWAASPAAAGAAASFPAQEPSAVMRFISQFSIDVYISATLSLLLFTYTQVAVACVSYLRCVDVEGVWVVFSQPAMRCGSEEYAKTKVLVVIALAIYVAGLPIGIMSFLWRRSAMVREAHALISRRIHGARSFSPSVVAAASGEVTAADEGFSPAVLSASKTANTAAVDRFLRRYAPLFAMYSSSAWFWQVFVLCRRTVFVTVSVLLLATPRRRFLGFTLSTLCSLLLQLVFRPFRLNFYNRAEFASHALLIVLSSTLTSESSPYSSGVDAFIFILVIPPLALYILYAFVEAVRRSIQDRALAEAANKKAAAMNHTALAAHSSFSGDAARMNGSKDDAAPVNASADDVVPVRIHLEHENRSDVAAASRSPLTQAVEMQQPRSPSVDVSSEL